MGYCIKYICDVSSRVRSIGEKVICLPSSCRDCSLTLLFGFSYYLFDVVQICLARKRSRLVRESFQYLEFAHEFKEYPNGIVSRQFVFTISTSFLHLLLSSSIIYIQLHLYCWIIFWGNLYNTCDSSTKLDMVQYIANFLNCYILVCFY